MSANVSTMGSKESCSRLTISSCVSLADVEHFATFKSAVEVHVVTAKNTIGVNVAFLPSWHGDVLLLTT